MGLYIFFFEYLDCGDCVDLWEQQFSLSYYSGGAITYSDVLEMSYKERHWFISRLEKQLKDEKKAMEQGRKK